MSFVDDVVGVSATKHLVRIAFGTSSKPLVADRFPTGAGGHEKLKEKAQLKAYLDGRSSAGHRLNAKTHRAMIFSSGTKNAIVHHLLYPALPRILAAGTP